MIQKRVFYGYANLYKMTLSLFKHILHFSQKNHRHQSEANF
jgi:hypothetical protein